MRKPRSVWRSRVSPSTTLTTLALYQNRKSGGTLLDSLGLAPGTAPEGRRGGGHQALHRRPQGTVRLGPGVGDLLGVPDLHRGTVPAEGVEEGGAQRGGALPPGRQDVRPLVDHPVDVLQGARQPLLGRHGLTTPTRPAGARAASPASSAPAAARGSPSRTHLPP